MSNKHLPHDLAQMQSLPLQAKIIMSQQRIRQWYEYWDGDVYTAFSGGIDSTVLKHLIDGMYSDVPSVFVNTGLEYPEIQSFVREIKAGKHNCFNSDIEIIRPEMRFDEVIKTYGYPVISKEVSRIIREARIGIKKNDGSYKYRIMKLNGELLKPDGTKSNYNCEKWKFMLDAPFNVSEKCCNVMKKKPSKYYEKRTGRKPFIGVMAGESRIRYQAWLKYGCNSFAKNRVSSTPLAFWTKQDILHYIQEYKVPYCDVYGEIVINEKSNNCEVVKGQMNLFDYIGEYSENDVLTTTGCDRTGCIFCMFGCHLEKDENRFQRLKKTHPKQYQYCINGGEYNEEGIWQPNNKGLGLSKVLDYIDVEY
jgi:3'-phosphoadenosine 5'-phosphosulfate sulfotransferase (PAPS reductase)/FAD synthetase